uniref:Uncharacterized protein n=1 Tax=Bursaphelenchus xylophilus TaxID=6326 RepID=A0A1I7RXH3_BURXY
MSWTCFSCVKRRISSALRTLSFWKMGLNYGLLKLTICRGNNVDLSRLGIAHNCLARVAAAGDLEQDCSEA